MNLRCSTASGTLAAYALLFLMGTVWLLSWDPGASVVPPDTARDLALAAHCRGPQGCILEGAPTSMPMVHQGGAWVIHLALLRHFGLGLTGIAAVSAVALALALTLLARLGEEVAGRTSGMLAFALAALLLDGAPVHVMEPQWNPTLTPLPAVGMALAALAAARTRRPLWYIVGALCNALAVQLHPIAVAFVPAWALLWVLAPPSRPWLTLGISVATFSASLASLSAESLLSAADLVMSRHAHSAIGWKGEGLGWLLWLGITAACALLVFLLPSDPRRKVELDAVLIFAMLPLALVSAGGVLLDWPASWWYVRPFVCLLALVPPIKLVPALARIAGRLWRSARGTAIQRMVPWFAQAAVALLLIGLVKTPPTVPATEFTWREASEVAARLPDLGVRSLSDAVHRVRGPGTLNLLKVLQAELPFGTSVSGDSSEILILRSRGEPSGLPQGTLRLPGRDGTSLYLIPRTATTIDWHKVDVFCATAGAGPEDRRGPWPVEPVSLSPVELAMVRGPAVSGSCAEIWMRLRVVPTSGDALTVIPASMPGDTKPPEVVAVRGLETLDPMPARSVVLAPGQQGRVGEVELHWSADGDLAYNGLPFAAALGVAEEALAQMLEHPIW